MLQTVRENGGGHDSVRGIGGQRHRPLHRRATELSLQCRWWWEIPYLDPQGRPYTYGDGVPFVRRKLKPGSDPKYLTPSGAGNSPYLSPLLPEGYLGGTKPLLITEGEKKADSLTAHGFPCIGLTGVYGWRDKRSGTSAPIPELGEINWRRPVRIVFDSDVVIKPQVLDALRDLTEHIVGDFYPDDPGLGGHIPDVVFLPSELNGEKNGADDFIVRHGADAFRRQLKVARAAVHWKGRHAHLLEPRSRQHAPHRSGFHRRVEGAVRHPSHTRDAHVQRQALGGGAGETTFARPTPPADG